MEIVLLTLFFIVFYFIAIFMLATQSIDSEQLKSDPNYEKHKFKTWFKHTFRKTLKYIFRLIVAAVAVLALLLVHNALLPGQDPITTLGNIIGGIFILIGALIEKFVENGKILTAITLIGIALYVVSDFLNTISILNSKIDKLEDKVYRLEAENEQIRDPDERYYY